MRIRDQKDYQRRGAERLIKDKLCRIKRLAVLLHHVVEMWTGRKAGAAYERNDIAAFHALPFFHQGLGKMPIHGLNAIPVIQFHHIAHFGIKCHGDHTTKGRSLYGGVRLGPDIEPVVPGWLLSERRDSGPKTRRDPTANRPDRRGGRPLGRALLGNLCQALESFFLLRGFPNEGF